VNNSVAIYTVLKTVPSGKVVTYGQLAKMAGLPGAARHVGRVMHQLPEGNDLPWHRVVNSQGRISMAENSPGYLEQKRRLLLEGIEFNKGRISLKIYQY